MKHRSIAAVVILTLITFGLYGIYWAIVTAREMRKLGANIPHGILIIIPIASYYWFWRYSAGVEMVTKGKWATPLVFLLFIITGIGGIVLGQLAFNEDVAGAAGGGGLSTSATGGNNSTSPAAAGGVVGLNQPTDQNNPRPADSQQVAQASGPDSSQDSAPMQDISPATAPPAADDTTAQETNVSSDDQSKDDTLSQTSSDSGESSESQASDASNDSPSTDPGSEPTEPESPPTDDSLSGDDTQNPTV